MVLLTYANHVFPLWYPEAGVECGWCLGGGGGVVGVVCVCVCVCTEMGIRCEHLCSPRSFWVFQSARKVSGKCIKGTPAVFRGCLQGTRLSITARDYFS